ncbi:MAG TPA: DUF4388 domain-containing protein [Nitriliruptorales bacterium]
MRGKLTDRPFADIARGLSNDEVTGALEVTGGPGVARVFFRTGDVYWAMSPAPRARLGDRLVNAGFITQDQLDHALQEQRQADERVKLGALLVDKALVGRDVIRVFVQEQILDALFDLVRWHAGDWVFHTGDAVDDKLPIDVPVSQLLVEVSRRQSEWDQIQRTIPTLEAIPDHVVGGNATTAALEQDEFTMLASIDGGRSVRELASDLGYNEFEAGRIVYGLTLLGIVEIVSDDDDQDQAPQAAAATTDTSPSEPVRAEAPADVSSDDDDIDVGAALEQALFGDHEPEAGQDGRDLEVTVHFTLDDAADDRDDRDDRGQASPTGAGARPRERGPVTPEPVADPPASARHDQAPPSAPAEPAAEAPATARPSGTSGTSFAGGPADDDEVEPWVFVTEDVDEEADEDGQPSPPEAPVADATTDLRAPDHAATRPTRDVPSVDDAASAANDLAALDDFFDDDLDLGDDLDLSDDLDLGDDRDEAPAARVDRDVSDDLDALVADLTDERETGETGETGETVEARAADAAGTSGEGPPPPSGSSAPGAPPPGADTDEAQQPTPTRRGDVSEFLRELSQLNIEGEDAPAPAPAENADEDGDKDGEERPPSARPPSARPPSRRDLPKDDKDDKKKKGRFGWGR